jgi:hypothetical protein
MLSLENLHSLSDGAVRQESSDRFLLLLQNAPTTKPVFFGDAKAATPPWPHERMSLLIDRLSTVLVACAIARAEDRQFHRTVGRDYADARIADLLGDQDMPKIAKALYLESFPRLCTGNGGAAAHRFDEYLPEAARWGQQYYEHVISPAYLNTIAVQIATGKPYLETLDLILSKLHFLLSSSIRPVIEAWQRAFPTAGIPVNPQSDYLSRARLVPDMYIPQVRSAIGVYRKDMVKQIRPGQGGAGGGTRTEWEEHRYYGEKVIEFLNGVPSKLGLVTGQRPDNHVKL